MTIVMVKKFVSTVSASGQVRCLKKSYAAQMIELIINLCYKVSLCILQITLRFVRELCIFSHEYSRKPKKLHNIN